MFIVTVATDGDSGGCLVGFVTQASIDPQRLMVLLSKENRTFDLAQRAEILVVHFLTAANKNLASLFGGTSGDTADKFDHCDWSPGPGDTPVLSGARGWVAGRILERIDAGDHVAHLIDVIAAQTDKLDGAMGFQAVRDIDPGHDA